MKITAPWTDEQVAMLNDYQQRGDLHPFTCPGDSMTGSADDCPRRELTATKNGWICACGRYTQDWAHVGMLK